MAGAATIPVTVPAAISIPARSIGSPKDSRISGVELINTELLSSAIAVTENMRRRDGGPVRVAVNEALRPDATGPAAMSSENSLPRSNPDDPAAGPEGHDISKGTESPPSILTGVDSPESAGEADAKCRPEATLDGHPHGSQEPIQLGVVDRGGQNGPDQQDGILLPYAERRPDQARVALQQVLVERSVVLLGGRPPIGLSLIHPGRRRRLLTCSLRGSPCSHSHTLHTSSPDV